MEYDTIEVILKDTRHQIITKENFLNYAKKGEIKFIFWHNLKNIKELEVFFQIYKILSSKSSVSVLFSVIIVI